MRARQDDETSEKKDCEEEENDEGKRRGVHIVAPHGEACTQFDFCHQF